MSNALELNKGNFEAEVLQANVPVLVDFWAPWCGPCKMMGPILDEVAKEMEGKIKIAKVNTEEEDNQELAEKYEIQSIPNMKLFRGGQVIAEFIGLRSKEILQKEIAEAVGK